MPNLALPCNNLTRMDKLGNDFELGRTVKQGIFGKRKDISEDLKAEIYMKMNEDKDKFHEMLNEKEKMVPQIGQLKDRPEFEKVQPGQQK